jgi:hypothetical protein
MIIRQAEGVCKQGSGRIFGPKREEVVENFNIVFSGFQPR